MNFLKVTLLGPLLLLTSLESYAFDGDGTPINLPLGSELSQIQNQIRNELNIIDEGIFRFSILAWQAQSSVDEQRVKQYLEGIHFYSPVDPESNESPSIQHESIFQGTFMSKYGFKRLKGTQAGRLLKTYLSNHYPASTWYQIGYYMSDGGWQSETGVILFSPSHPVFYRLLINEIP